MDLIKCIEASYTGFQLTWSNIEHLLFFPLLQILALFQSVLQFQVVIYVLENSPSWSPLSLLLRLLTWYATAILTYIRITLPVVDLTLAFPRVLVAVISRFARASEILIEAIHFASALAFTHHAFLDAFAFGLFRADSGMVAWLILSLDPQVVFLDCPLLVAKDLKAHLVKEFLLWTDLIELFVWNVDNLLLKVFLLGLRFLINLAVGSLVWYRC